MVFNFKMLAYLKISLHTKMNLLNILPGKTKMLQWKIFSFILWKNSNSNTSLHIIAPDVYLSSFPSCNHTSFCEEVRDRMPSLLFVPRTRVCILLSDKNYVINHLLSFDLVTNLDQNQICSSNITYSIFFSLWFLFVFLGLFLFCFVFWLYFAFLVFFELWLEVHCINSTSIYYSSSSFFLFPVLFISLALTKHHLTHLGSENSLLCNVG